jgi:hypothetical protein
MDVLETITSTPTCNTCRYYLPHTDSTDDGLCRRYPPQKDAVTIGSDDWCGEYTHA